MKYAVEDQETRCFVSSDSVFITDEGRKILYSTHTGRASGLEYSSNLEIANVIAESIKNIFNKYHISKEFNIVEIHNKNDLPKGELKIEHILTKH